MCSKSRTGTGGPVSALAVFVATLLLSSPAAAYIGPGAGLSAIGTALALIATVCLAIVGFLWYPAKRLSRRLFGKPAQSEGQGDDRAGEARPTRPPT